jgi:hypothetical protein
MTVRSVDELSNRFAYHPPAGPHIADAHEELREAAYTLAAAIERLVPPGRERVTAITKCEEAMMWGNAGVARASGLARLEAGDHHGPHTERR